MTTEQFDQWLSGLKGAWVHKKPQQAADLCAENVIWYELPFGPPYTTKKEVLIEWQSLPTSQKDIEVTYEILAITDTCGLAHWSARYTDVSSGEKVYLDGIFQVTLNAQNLCTEFHQWYNAKC